LSEAALWLNYGLSGVVAFVSVYFLRWRLLPSMILGMTISLLLYLAVSFARGGWLDDPWFEAALFINGSFALVAAVGGAIVARAVRDFWNAR